MDGESGEQDVDYRIDEITGYKVSERVYTALKCGSDLGKLCIAVPQKNLCSDGLHVSLRAISMVTQPGPVTKHSPWCFYYDPMLDATIIGVDMCALIPDVITVKETSPPIQIGPFDRFEITVDFCFDPESRYYCDTNVWTFAVPLWYLMVEKVKWYERHCLFYGYRDEKKWTSIKGCLDGSRNTDQTRQELISEYMMRLARGPVNRNTGDNDANNRKKEDEPQRVPDAIKSRPFRQENYNQKTLNKVVDGINVRKNDYILTESPYCGIKLLMFKNWNRYNYYPPIFICLDIFRQNETAQMNVNQTGVAVYKGLVTSQSTYVNVVNSLKIETGALSVWHRLMLAKVSAEVYGSWLHFTMQSVQENCKALQEISKNLPANLSVQDNLTGQQFPLLVFQANPLKQLRDKNDIGPFACIFLLRELKKLLETGRLSCYDFLGKNEINGTTGQLLYNTMQSGFTWMKIDLDPETGRITQFDFVPEATIYNVTMNMSLMVNSTDGSFFVPTENVFINNDDWFEMKHRDLSTDLSIALLVMFHRTA